MKTWYVGYDTYKTIAKFILHSIDHKTNIFLLFLFCGLHSRKQYQVLLFKFVDFYDRGIKLRNIRVRFYLNGGFQKLVYFF